jgi:hypothetical protein
VILKNENGSTEFDFKFYVTVEGGMDFRAMLMKRKVKQKKVVVKKIEWLEVSLRRVSGEPLNIKITAAQCSYSMPMVAYVIFH